MLGGIYTQENCPVCGQKMRDNHRDAVCCPQCGEVMCAEVVDEPVGERFVVIDGFSTTSVRKKMMAIYYCDTCGYQGKPAAIKGG